MSIIRELICFEINEHISRQLKLLDMDCKDAVFTNTINILKEIKTIIQNDELDDFTKVDEIVDLLAEHWIDTGNCHDF